MDKVGLLNESDSVFVLIYFQDRLITAIKNDDNLIKNISIMLRASEIFSIPLIVTEQYPKGLGKTSLEITLPKNYRLVEKTSFDCFAAEEFVRYLSTLSIKNLIIFGLEAHICVLKTALSGVKSNYNVHVVADAVASRSVDNKFLGLERMRQSGVFIVPMETVLFQLLENSKQNEFKQISELVK